MTYAEFITEVQNILGEFMPNEQPLTQENTDALAKRLLTQGPVNPYEPKKGHHQTVAVYREKRNWVPVTVHFQTGEDGRIEYVRVHTTNFIREYGPESV